MRQRDRLKAPLGAVGFGGRDALRRRLEAERAAREEDARDAADAALPKPKPSRSTELGDKGFPQPKNPNWIPVKDSDIADLVTVCEDAMAKGQLSSWEEDFLSSVRGQVRVKYGLTKNQYEKLADIAEKNS